MLGFGDSNTWITRDPSGNLVLNDISAGQRTLTELADHGSLDGLLDDDHPQYLRTDGTREVDGYLVPSVDDAYGLGLPDQRWSDLFLGPNSLHIVSTASETGSARNWHIGLNASGDLTFVQGVDNKVIIEKSGRVGIGTEVPSALLHVETNTTSNPALTLKTLDNSANLVTFLSSVGGQIATISATGRIRAASGSEALPGLSFVSDTDTGLYSGGDGTISFSNNGSASWQINSGAIISANNANGIIRSGTNPGASFPSYSWSGDSNTGMFNRDDDEIGWSAGGQEKMFLDPVGLTVNGPIESDEITASGHILPGTDDTYDLGENTTPLRWGNLYLGPSSLHIVSTSSETTTARDYNLEIEKTAGAEQGYFRVREGSTDLLTVTYGGNLGVGVTDPASSLTVSGDGYFFGNIGATGDITASNASFILRDSAIISAPTDGNLLLTNSSGTDFDLLQLGGTSGLYPALKRDGYDLKIRSADDTSDASLYCADATASGNITSVGWIWAQSTIDGAITSNGGVKAGNTKPFWWNTRSRIYSPADGKIQIVNNAQDTGIVLDASANSLQVRNRIDSADATIYVRQVQASDVIQAGQSFFIGWNGRSRTQSPADGNILFTNNAEDNFSLLQFGGQTSSYPAIKRNGTDFELRLADDSDYTNLWLDNIYVQGTFDAYGDAYFHGDLEVAGDLITAPTTLRFKNSTRISSPDDGDLLLQDNAGGDFGTMYLGGKTSSHVGIRGDSGTLTVIRGDDLQWGTLQTGQIYAQVGGVQLASTLKFNWNTRSEITSPADGNILLTNDAGTDFTRLQLGGTSSSFPSWQRSGAHLEARKADGSAYCNITLQDLNASGQIQVGSAYSVLWASRSQISSPADSDLLLQNAAGDNFDMLMLGGTTSGFPALQRSGTNLAARLADDSGYATFVCDNLYGTGDLQAGSTSEIYWNTRTAMSAPADGNVLFADSAGTDFGLLQFGGITSSFPAIKRNGTGIQIRLSDDSGLTDVEANDITANSIVVSDGNATGPSFSFAGDTNTGVFRVGEDILAITTGGSEAIRVDDSGNVGIGISTINAPLHVAGYAIAAHPISDDHLATKAYVDGIAQGLSWQAPVILDDLTDPPPSPVDGDGYIVGGELDEGVATGAWAGKEEQIARWNGSGWGFIIPDDGYAVWVTEKDYVIVYNSEYPGGHWIRFGSTVIHANLQGLSADDHTHYLRVDGYRGMTGDLVPDVDLGVSLGTPSLRWEDGYFGPSSLYVSSTAAETGTERNWQLAIDTTGGGEQGSFRVLEGVNQRLTIDTSGNFTVGELIRLGGITSSYPALKRNGTELQIKVADDSVFAGINVLSVTLAGNRSKITSPVDGNLKLSDNALADFGLLQFGGTTSSFPALKRNSTVLETKLADDSAYCDLRALNLVAGGTAAIRWNGRNRMSAPLDGDLLLTNNTSNDFNMLQFGGTANSYPALKRVGKDIHFRLADDTDYASVAIETLDAYGEVNIHGASAIRMSVTGDGTLLMTDEVGTAFSLIQLGGTTNSYPAIKRNTTYVEMRLADDSGFANLNANFISATTSNNNAFNTIGGLEVGSTKTISWTSRSELSSPSDGNILLTDTAGTDFGLLQLGGTTNSYPAIKRDGTSVHFRLADDTDPVNILAGDYRAGSVNKFYWLSRSKVSSPSDGMVNITNSAGGDLLGIGHDGTDGYIYSGVGDLHLASQGSDVLLTNSAGNDFGFLQFGGTTSSYPALKRSTTTLHAKLADDSGFAGIQALWFQAQTSVVVGTIFAWNTKSRLYSDVDGNIRLTNDASDDFGLLQFGGTSSSYPAIKRNGTELDISLADDSGLTNLNVLDPTEASHAATRFYIDSNLDGYTSGAVNNQRWADSSQQRQDLRDAADGYGLHSVMDQRWGDSSQQRQDLRDAADGYGLHSVMDQRWGDSSQQRQDLRDSADGYGLHSVMDQRWGDSSQQRQDLRNAADGYGLHSVMVRDAADGYSSDITIIEGDIANLDSLVDQRWGDSSQQRQDLRDAADGYGLHSVMDQRWGDSSQQRQDLRDSADGYGLHSVMDQRWGDSSQQRQDLRNALDGYAVFHNLVNERWGDSSQQRQDLRDAADGYGLHSVMDQRWGDSSQQRQDLRNAADGYGLHSVMA
jgi:hypothetical protein